MPRLLDKYRMEIAPKMMERFAYKNVMAVPKLEKIVVSMGVGSAREDRKRLDAAAADLATITGQKAVLTQAKRSVAGFKLREGMMIGCKVTMRSHRMYEFLDRLISLAIPRIKDFRGLSRKSFDGHGNYSMGLSEQVVFPEISIDTVEHVQGMNICIATTARTDEEARELLAFFGMPFREN